MADYFEKLLPEEIRKRFSCFDTVAELLEFCRREYGSLPAVSDKKNTYSYEEFYSRIAMRRQFIKEQNIPEGSNLAVLARNDLDAMELYLAVMSAGYTVVMLPVALNAASMRSIEMKFDLAGIFVAEEFYQKTAGLKCPVWPSDSIAETETLVGKIDKNTVAAIYFTGGTTGSPKGAVLTHGALIRGAYNGIFLREDINNNIYMAILPLHHIFGSVRGFLSALYVGALTYACRDVKFAFVDIPVVKPTTLILVPGLMELLLGFASKKGAGYLESLRMIVAGGAPIPHCLITKFKVYGVNVYPGYALTEGGGMTAGSAEADTRPGTVGKIFKDQEVQIIDGEVCIRGDNVMLGYYKEPELTAEALKDGWLRTGDLGRFDEEGFLYITGRKKNLIILSNGENVSPEEIEDLFYEQQEVAECLVKEMEVKGHPVVGIEVFSNQLEGCSDEELYVRLQDVVHRVNAQLPGYKQVKKLLVRREPFPRTASMKIVR